MALSPRKEGQRTNNGNYGGSGPNGDDAVLFRDADLAPA